jgi:16S rRNA G966 N2-methylase RsmD
MAEVDNRRKTFMLNTLYSSDNLNIMRESSGTETIDLIYLDPPFNSKPKRPLQRTRDNRGN